jgi:hypothetical protein
MARKRYPEQLGDPKIDRRLATERANIARETQDPLTKLSQAADLTDDLTGVVSHAIADPAFPVRDQHAAHVIFAALRTQTTGVLNGLVMRLSAKLEIPYGLDNELRASAIQFDDGPIVEAVLDSTTPRSIANSCAALIGPTAISLLLDEYLSVITRLRRDGRPPKGDVDRHAELMGLIASTRPSLFATAVISRGPPEGASSIGMLGDLFARHGKGDGKVWPPLTEHERQALVAIFRQCAEMLLAIEPPPRHE